MELSYDSDAGMGNTPYFNGNISAIKWKGAGEASGSNGQRSYKFTYDKTNRLTAAGYQKYATAWDKELNALNETQSYDHNGNILGLSRKKIKREIGSGFAITTSAETIDNLIYTYGTATANQLVKVEDSGTTEGFKNGDNQSVEYSYSTDGGQVSDLNKGISSITYNLLGKPQVITYSGSPAKTATYTYDASGTKLKVVINDGTTTKTTDYVGGFIYENTALSMFSSPEGRVVKNGSNFEYQYSIADHQKNTRVVFSSQAPAPVVTTATLEDNTQTDEQTKFQNYPTGGNRSSLELFDNTDFNGSVYNKSQLLNGGNNSQVGLSKSFKVYAGDVIHAEVYAKYWNVTSTTSNISGFAAALVGAFGLTGATTGDALLAKNALQNYGGVVAGAGGSGSSSAPKAFITVLLFDQNHNFVDAAFDQIGTAGEQIGASPKVAFDLLTNDVTVKEPGYAYVYISNENPTQVDVYFDDLKIEHRQGHVIQYNEYYPFGMENQNSWTRENAKDNNFLYNAGNEQNALTGLYDMFYRNYDPLLGRMTQIDPAADSYGSLTTYGYANNDPVYFNDPTGAITDDQWWSAPRAAWGNRVSPEHWRSEMALAGKIWSERAYRGEADRFEGDGSRFGAGFLPGEVFGSPMRFEQQFNVTEVWTDWYTFDGEFIDTYLTGYRVEAKQAGGGSNRNYSFGATGWAPFDYEEGRYSAKVMATYSMDVNLSVFQVPVYGEDLKVTGYQWKARVSATSYVSFAGEGTVLGNAQVSLMADGQVLSTKALSVQGDVLIRGGSQYSYVGEATFDLPAIPTLQIGISGGWVIEYDKSNRFIPTYDPLLFYPIQVNGVMNVNRSGR